MLELELDHVGIAVEDLERGRAAFARLGFRLTARSLHAGSPAPAAPVIPWGSGNHCAMLESGYLEVIGLTDRSLYSSVKDMVARYQGLHIVALGCGDADAAYQALAGAGLPVDAPRALERDAAFGPSEDGLRRARFRNIYLDRERYPEARFLYIEHLTREVLWQPHLLRHPNGAIGLEATYFCAAQAQAAGDKIAQAMRVRPEAAGAGHVRMQLARGSLHVFEPSVWTALSGQGPLPPLPAPVGVCVRVASLQAVRTLLAQGGVQTVERDGIWVGPAEACGASVRFIE
ncbi:MAG: VOC family protein [Burkholderiales bacterium]|nr:VOC family protein [Burkholderiales bacterium]